MKQAIRCITALLLALPLLVAAPITLGQQVPANETASTPKANVTAKSTEISHKTKKDRALVKAEAIRAAEWREQRARRLGATTDVSLARNTCVYSRSTLTYSCQ